MPMPPQTDYPSVVDHQFINNQWVPSEGTRLLDVMNPFRE